MEKEILEEQLNLGLSTWKLADYFNTTQPNIRYWLKKYNLQTNRKKNDVKGYKLCPKCKIDKPLANFYKSIKTSSYCRDCMCESNLKKRQETKLLAIAYKGGKCIKCGYNKCAAALDFHHLDPKEKDKNYINHRSGFTTALKIELDKCVLLCANCHREEHHLNTSK